MIENSEFGIEHSESEIPGGHPSDLQNEPCVYGFTAWRKDLACREKREWFAHRWQWKPLDWIEMESRQHKKRRGCLKELKCF